MKITTSLVLPSGAGGNCEKPLLRRGIPNPVALNYAEKLEQQGTSEGCNPETIAVMRGVSS